MVCGAVGVGELAMMDEPVPRESAYPCAAGCPCRQDVFHRSQGQTYQERCADVHRHDGCQGYHVGAVCPNREQPGLFA